MKKSELIYLDSFGRAKFEHLPGYFFVYFYLCEFEFALAARFIEWDKQFVWHPFTGISQWVATGDEPGRMIVGNAGVLVTRVVYVKEGSTKTFLIADAGMNDLIRPTLYDAYHTIVTEAQPQPGVDLVNVDIVGPICETGDTFAKNRKLPPVASGDLLVVRTVGAYGAVQASTYNTRPLVAEVMVNGDAYCVVRERMSVEDIIALDRLPDWLGD